MASHGRTGKPITFDPNRLGHLDARNLEFIREAAFPGSPVLSPGAALSLAMHLARAVIEQGAFERFRPPHLTPASTETIPP